MTGLRRAWFPVVVWVMTVIGLAAAVIVPVVSGGGDQFDGKGWAVRLVVYPALMLVAPGVWWAARRRRGDPAPYAPFGLIMVPFLSDTAANWLDLFRQVSWWDDASHAAHWFLLCAGLGLLVSAHVRPRWVVVPLVAGAGALLALAWELGEWWLFIRHGVEARGAYRDTLGDQALGTAGAFAAALAVAWHHRGALRTAAYSPQV